MRTSNPGRNRFAGCFGEYELDRALSLLLHHDGARSYPITVRHVAHLNLHQVASAQLAINGQVEQRKISAIT